MEAACYTCRKEHSSKENDGKKRDGWGEMKKQWESSGINEEDGEGKETSGKRRKET